MSLPKRVLNWKNIGKYAFEASGLKNITIPNSVSEIGAQAFGNCSRLENVTLSKKLKGIEYEVFINVWV